MKIPKTFIGWTNIKWFFKEIMNLYSDKPSYFSKKRIESGIAFIIAQTGMVAYLISKIDTMDVYEFLMWAGAEFLIAGYTINQIQKEKKTRTPDDMS
jgi:hypothetical protein